MSDYRTIKELVIATCAAEGQFPSYEKLTSLVRQHFPTSKWQKTHYAWYKSKIKSGKIHIAGVSRQVLPSPPIRDNSRLERISAERGHGVLLPDTVLQNRYRIIRHLAAGGMGAIYEAVDERLKSRVAVKRRAVNDLRLHDAFEHEACLLANLNHPALPIVRDHFFEGEHQFLVMRYVAGPDLLERLKENGRPFEVGRVLEWADQLLDALEYLHSHSPPIIHRDIKPANTKISERGQVILLDFGLAKGTLGQMSTLVDDRSVFGFSRVYAPVEQVQGTGTDPRSDIYSLGSTLYHLITGVQPVDAPTRYNAIEEGRSDPLRPAGIVNSEVTQNLSEAIGKAMAIRKSERWASASEMRTALKVAVSGRSGPAVEGTTRQRL